MKVCIGSLNQVKVKAVADQLEPLGITVISKDVASQVSNQPFSDAETVLGATNRAKSAQAFAPIGIGLEAGVEMLNGVMFLVNWGVLIDEDHHIYYAGGTRLPLPKELALPLESGLELGDVIDAYAKRQNVRSKEGAIGILTADWCSRQVNFEHIVSLLWGQYVYRHQSLK